MQFLFFLCFLDVEYLLFANQVQCNQLSHQNYIFYLFSNKMIFLQLVVWWQTSEDEVYPWSPLAKDRDRANILVYSLHSTSLDLVCYCRTEMAPLSVSFSRVQPNVLLTVEQGFGKKGGVTVLSCVYEVGIRNVCK